MPRENSKSTGGDTVYVNENILSNKGLCMARPSLYCYELNTLLFVQPFSCPVTDSSVIRLPSALRSVLPFCFATPDLHASSRSASRAYSAAERVGSALVECWACSKLHVVMADWASLLITLPRN